MTLIASTSEGRREQFGQFMLGTGGIGGIASAAGPGLGLSDDDGLSLIDRAVADGFRALDTADVYTSGNSERVVGMWNRKHPDAGLLIQTKTGATATGPDLAPERVARQLARSVTTLGRVDLFVAHLVDPATSWEASLPAFSAAVEDGTILAYGLSNVTAADLERALAAADRLGISRPSVVQNAYSLVERSDDQTVLPTVASEGLAYTPYSPLANGLLAGRYSSGEQPAFGSRASVASKVGTYLSDIELMERIRSFDELAVEYAVSPAGLAMGWLVNRPHVTAPIVGPSRESQWQAITEARALRWDATLSSRLDELFPSA